MNCFKKIFILVFIMVSCFCLKNNVYAITLPELKITRFDYSIGDKVVDEDDSYYTTSIGTNIRLYASMIYENDVACSGCVIGNFVNNTNLENVTWSSSSPGVASIDSNGVLTAISGGTTIVTAQYADPDTNEIKSDTKSITIIGETCDPRGININTYRVYLSTGLANGYNVVELKTYSGADHSPIYTYNLPTPSMKDYTFDGWYASKDFKEEDKINNLGDTDWDFNYQNSTIPCKSYLQIGTIYAKWVPIIDQGSVPTDIDQSTNTNTNSAQTVKVDDTGLGSNLYIIAVAILLLTFGILMIIISLKDNKVQVQ